MELGSADLAKELGSGKIRRVYYLFGEETADKEAALRLIEKTIGRDEFNYSAFSGALDDDLPRILSELETLPVFSQRRLVVVRGPAFPAAMRKALAEYLKNPAEQTTLALVSDEKKPDARDALAQAALAAGVLCAFGALKEDAALARVFAEAKKAGKTISNDAAAALIREVGTNWKTLDQELQKILLFCGGAAVSMEDVLACLGYRKSADPFALARLILDRKPGPVVSHLRRFLEDGKPQDQAFRALSQMSSSVQKQLRAKIMLEAGMSESDIAKALRLHPYWDRDFVRTASRFGVERLASDLKICLRTDRALKSQAWLDTGTEVETAALNLCRSGY
ncbi:MAG: DNA polymerase III subunit delta [Elusimicrobiota bacterium]